MVAVPENQVTQQDLITWAKMKEDLAKLKTAEMLLRKKIFDAYFPQPKEGTNSFEIAPGYSMKGKYPIIREVDPGALGAYADQFKEAAIVVSDLVKYSPSLVLGEYRTLTEEQRKLFDNALIVKPGSVSLEIVEVKKKGKE